MTNRLQTAWAVRCGFKTTNYETCVHWSWKVGVRLDILTLIAQYCYGAHILPGVLSADLNIFIITYCLCRIRFTHDVYPLSGQLMLSPNKPQNRSVCYMYHLFDTERKLRVSSTPCIPYDYTTKRHYCPKLHWMFRLCNGGAVCFLWCRTQVYYII